MDGLAQKLKVARKAKKLTQQQVADALNICRSAYTKYETDRAEPSLDTLRRIGEILELSAEELLK